MHSRSFVNSGSFLIALQVLVSCARADIIPIYESSELTRYSDLVILGVVDEEGLFQIREVLKGQTTETQLRIFDFKELANEGHFAPPQNVVRLGSEAIAFLDLRSHRPRIVANGVYRLGQKDGRQGVFGYGQPINPGGYVLSAEIQFATVADVRSLVLAEVKEIPKRQQELLSALRAGPSLDETLRRLNFITRIGDKAVIQQIGEYRGPPKSGWHFAVARFIGEVGDPSGAKYLEALYDEFREETILENLGMLGNRDSLQYFNTRIENGSVRDRANSLRGLRQLYLSLEAAGDRDTCDRVRDSIYRQVDADFPGLVVSQPHLISIIPEQASLGRLRRARQSTAGREPLAAQRIDRCIRECDDKIQSLKREIPTPPWQR